jgi:hypothetical protein
VPVIIPHPLNTSALSSADAACVGSPAAIDAVKAFNWVMSSPKLKVTYSNTFNGSLVVRLRSPWKGEADFCVDIPGGLA